MGAAFVSRSFPLDKYPDTVSLKKKFIEWQDQDKHENGHSYSGGIGMAEGLQINPVTLTSYADAEDFLDNHAKKFGPAIAIKYKYDDGLVYWMIGAVCAE